ncbi:MAG TPA: hypothetical protein VGD76_01955 [Ramlibacter sp.]
MPRVSFPTLGLVATLALVVLLTRFQGTLGEEALPARPGLSAQDTANLLRGTWEREYTEGGVRVRRVLSLEAGGTFHEKVRIVDAAGRLTQQAHAGTWLYDGTNLKRKYTLMNGEPPSRLNVPFATFEVSFDSANEFTGVNHVHRQRIHYRRIGFDAAQ